jgi:hypothetical protein
MRWWRRKKKVVSPEELERVAHATRNSGSRLLSNQGATPTGKIGVVGPDDPKRN